MAIAVLITQCLQRDFVDLVPKDVPLPNKLHVGREEARRLLGDDPAIGPVAQLAAWARAQESSELRVIHIRDWHDASDPRQKSHLATFGQHCVRNTPGAELVGGLGDMQASMVDAIGLNDFEATTLRDALADLAGKPVRVGVVGVWTDAKVSYLLYDLKTRLGIDDLATCSALTASSSRSQHFNALSQLENLLGVKVYDSIADFTGWLLPKGNVVDVQAAFGPQLEIAGKLGADVELSTIDRDILGFLFRDSKEVKLSVLSGGFSGSRVFRAASADSFGHVQAPSVVKVGPRASIATERTNFERVEEILGNAAPAMRASVDLGDRAGIKFAFAAMGHGKVRTLKSLFDENAPQNRIDSMLTEAFEIVLAPFWQAAQFERLSLLPYYQFSPKWAASVREKVEAISGKRESPLCDFYETYLPAVSPDDSEFHFVSYVHGDLNGANLLLDANDNVWMIDFFHTSRGHVLKDLAKLENDLLYIWTKVETEADLAEALAITRALAAVSDLGAPLPETIGVSSAQFVRAWHVLRLLRGWVAKLVRHDRDPRQLSIALLRYAAHTLGFEQSNAWQKKWALASAEGHAQAIAAGSRWAGTARSTS